MKAKNYLKDINPLTGKKMDPEKESKTTSSCDTMLEEQIGKEYQSMMLYHALGIWLDSSGYRRIARWFYAKGNEEIEHAKGIIDFMFDTGKEVSPQVQCKLEKEIKPKDLRDVFVKALEHEMMVTERLSKIQDKAEESSDRLTYNFLQAYLKEQVEEEKVLRDRISDLDVIERHQGDIFSFMQSF